MELETAASTIEVSENGIVIRWSDGARSRFHSLWLRHNCPTAVAVSELNPDVWVMDAFRNDEGDLEIEFSDGHETSFKFDWIRAHVHEPHDRRGRLRLVHPIRAGHELDRFDAPVRESGEHLDLLESLSKFGAAIVTGTEDVGASLFDIGEVAHSVVTQQDFVLAPRTEDAYRYVPPAITLLRSDDSTKSGKAGGGEVIIVDGFGIALDLRNDDPDVFDMLSETSIPFRHRTTEAHFVAHGPIISLDRDYEISGIRFDESAVAPLDLDPGMVSDYYRALIAFAEEVNNPVRAQLVRLGPDDTLVLDNHRMLRGESGFARLRRTEIPREMFHSRLRQLRQKHGKQHIDERFPSGPRY